MTKVIPFVVALLFYAGWFGSVFLAKTSFAPWSLLFPLALTALLLASRRIGAAAFLAAALTSLAGILFDSALAKLGFVEIAGQNSWLVPSWLIAIWLSFSLSTMSLGPLFRGPAWFKALLGFALGPLSYKSGEILGVLTFLSPWTFWIYAAFWGLSFPLILILSRRFA